MPARDGCFEPVVDPDGALDPRLADQRLDVSEEDSPLRRPLPRPEAQGVDETEHDLVLATGLAGLEHSDAETAREHVEPGRDPLGPRFEFGLAPGHHHPPDGHGDWLGGDTRKLAGVEGTGEECRHDHPS